MNEPWRLERPQPSEGARAAAHVVSYLHEPHGPVGFPLLAAVSLDRVLASSSLPTWKAPAKWSSGLTLCRQTASWPPYSLRCMGGRLLRWIAEQDDPASLSPCVVAARAAAMQKDLRAHRSVFVRNWQT